MAVVSFVKQLYMRKRCTHNKKSVLCPCTRQEDPRKLHARRLTFGVWIGTQFKRSQLKLKDERPDDAWRDCVAVFIYINLESLKRFEGLFATVIYSI